MSDTEALRATADSPDGSPHSIDHPWQGISREATPKSAAEQCLPEVALAEVVADWLLRERAPRRKKYFLAVNTRSGLPLPPFHYRYKSSVGVAFDYRDTADARAWVIDALLAGHWVYRTASRTQWGIGYGRSLAEGPLSAFQLADLTSWGGSNNDRP